MSSYWCSIVTMALSRVVPDIFNVEKYCDLEIPVKGQSRSSKVIPCDSLLSGWGFLLVFYSNFVLKKNRLRNIRLWKCRDLENRVKVPSRSLIMSPFDRAHTTSYNWRSIVTVALSLVVSEIFNVENIVILKSRSMVNWRHWKWYHSIDWVWFPISVL